MARSGYGFNASELNLTDVGTELHPIFKSLEKIAKEKEVDRLRSECRHMSDFGPSLEALKLEGVKAR